MVKGTKVIGIASIFLMLMVNFAYTKDDEKYNPNYLCEKTSRNSILAMFHYSDNNSDTPRHIVIDIYSQGHTFKEWKIIYAIFSNWDEYVSFQITTDDFIIKIPNKIPNKTTDDSDCVLCWVLH